MRQPEKILAEAENEAKKAKNEAELNLVKSRYLGRKSQLATAMATLSKLPVSERKLKGAQLNKLRGQLEELFVRCREVLVGQQIYAPVDLTLPSSPDAQFGHLHPVSQILAEVYRIFESLGFAIVDGPEIESDWYNFEALNMPPEHPAREMQDTFYLNETYEGKQLIPRTHASGMQVRFLEQNQPPVKIIYPGKVFRNENEDATHSWIFSQIEGMVVGENISLTDLKGTLEYFVRGVLGQDSRIRLRPSYFPYTEPSVEIDAYYQGEWLELLGAGMMRSQVLENAGIDSKRHNGFAFGAGADRLAQVKFAMTDLRQNWRPNLFFLEQF